MLHIKIIIFIIFVFILFFALKYYNHFFTGSFPIFKADVAEYVLRKTENVYLCLFRRYFFSSLDLSDLEVRTSTIDIVVKPTVLMMTVSRPKSIRPLSLNENSCDVLDIK